MNKQAPCACLEPSFQAESSSSSRQRNSQNSKGKSVHYDAKLDWESPADQSVDLTRACFEKEIYMAEQDLRIRTCFIVK